MLALISKTEGKTEIYRESEIDFPVIQVRIKRRKALNGMLKKLKRMGVTRVVADEEINQAKVKGFHLADGEKVIKMLVPRIAIHWLADNNMPTTGLGVEMKNIGADTYNAVRDLKDNIRWLSLQCPDSLKNQIYRQFGLSAIDGGIPPTLCKTPLKLYFEKGNLFTYGGIRGTGAQIILPPPYDRICPSGCIKGFARALMENGLITHSEIKIKNVYICNKT